MTVPFVISIPLVWLTIWIMAMFRCYRYLRIQAMVKKSMDEKTDETSSLPTMSVVIPTYEQCDALQRNLLTVLEQDYPQDYEVVVVDMNSTDDTRIYLESLGSRYPHLHVTRMPDTVRNVSPIRLALTLGIRAASNEWVVMTQPNCRPSSEHWLTQMGQTCTRKQNAQIVLGYTHFIKGRGWNGLRCRFFRLWQQMLHFPLVLRHGAYRAEGTNLCYRRSLFLEHRGFAEHSNLLIGATDIMVNHFSNRKNTTVCLHPEAQMLQESPRHARWWRQERLFFMETRRHFRHWILYRIKYALHVMLTWLFTLSTMAVAVATLLLWHNYLLFAAIVFLWLIHAICRQLWFNRSARALGERSFTFTLPLLLHLVAWWDTTAWLRWLFTKKKLFQKKFI